MSSIRPATFPRVDNVLLVEANTEYSFGLHDSIRRFTIRARQPVSFKLSFQPGQSGTHYLELHPSEVWTEEEVYGGVTLYLQSPDAGTVIEVLQWIQK